MVREYVRIRGVKYSCGIRLGSVDGLDPLAEFFHSEVLDQESHIKTLINSFGLPPRVVEDVLADLLKRGYAVLDPKNGRILKLPGTSRGRREFRLGSDLKLWQDSFTGGLLPISVTDLYRNAPMKGRIVELAGHSYSTMRFMDAPDAHIISELSTIDPHLAVQDAGWIPDSLVNKERLGALDLFLPLSSAEIDGRTVTFVDARTFPSWLTRQWSRALQPPESSVSFPQITSATGQTEVAQGAEENIFADVDIERLVDIFQGAFFNVLRMSPPPTRRSHLYDLEAKHAELQIRIETAGRVALYAPTGKSHLREMWEGADAYLLVCVPKLDVASLESLVSVTLGQSAQAKYLVVVSPDIGAVEGVATSLGSRRGDVILMGAKDLDVPECCIRDALEVRFGTLKKLLGQDQLLTVAGRGALEIVLSRISEAVHGQPGSTWISRRLWQEGRRSAVAPEVLDISSCFGLAVETLRANIGTKVEVAIEGSPRGSSLVDRLPQLRDTVESLCFTAPSRFADLADAFCSTEGRRISEIIDEAVKQLTRDATPVPLLLMSSHWTGDLASREVIAQLRNASAHQVTVQIIVAAVERPEQGQERLGDLKQLVGCPNISVVRCTRYLPDLIVYNNYVIVFLAHLHGLDSRVGFVAASKRAADQLRSVSVHPIV